MTLNQCDTCPANPVNANSDLVKLGVDKEGFDFVIALAGNPNTGKSTVFNSLTGLKQHTGNWPGKTVTRAEGGFSYAGKKYKIVDLPGTYSLLSTSTDEEVARDFILFGQPDVTVIVVDATRLERNLNLVLQVLEITDHAVLCVNLIDEAARHKIKIDIRELSRKLGIPVVPAAARQGKGIPELLNYINEVATGKYICKPHRITSGTKELTNAVKVLSEQIQEQFPKLPNARWVALRLLEGDQKIIDAVRTGDLGNLERKESITVEDAGQENS
jgi:ferrous iron transport protein B